MRHRILLSLISISLLICACSEEPAPVVSTWCVLIDMSGVREDHETRKRYSENFSRIMEEIGPGDVLVAAFITESSVNESEFLVNHRFSAFQPTTDNEMYLKAEKEQFESAFAKEKTKVGKSISDFILNDERISPSTDIISAISVAADVFKKYTATEQNLILLSDMEQNSSDYKFPSEKLNDNRISEIINSEGNKSRGYPVLDNVRVYVCGAKSNNSDRFFNIKKFWLSYFEKCGAITKAEDYGAAFISI